VVFEDECNQLGDCHDPFVLRIKLPKIACDVQSDTAPTPTRISSYRYITKFDTPKVIFKNKKLKKKKKKTSGKIMKTNFLRNGTQNTGRNRAGNNTRDIFS
jgi:hypothetical protein